MAHVYEVRPRRDHRGVDLMSDALPFGRLWYGDPNAIRYAKFYSRSHHAVIRVYDGAGNVTRRTSTWVISKDAVAPLVTARLQHITNAIFGLSEAYFCPCLRDDGAPGVRATRKIYFTRSIYFGC